MRGERKIDEVLLLNCVSGPILLQQTGALGHWAARVNGVCAHARVPGWVVTLSESVCMCVCMCVCRRMCVFVCVCVCVCVCFPS